MASLRRLLSTRAPPRAVRLSYAPSLRTRLQAPLTSPHSVPSRAFSREPARTSEQLTDRLTETMQRGRFDRIRNRQKLEEQKVKKANDEVIVGDFPVKLDAVVKFKVVRRMPDGETKDWVEQILYQQQHQTASVEGLLEGKVGGDVVKTTSLYEAPSHRVEKKALENRLEKVDAELKIGAQFDAQTSTGNQTRVTVVDIEEMEVVLKQEDPLDGQEINYDILVLSVRPATSEEKEFGEAIDYED